MSADTDDLVRYGINAAIDAGHDPADVRQWAEGDLIQYATHKLHHD